MDLERLKVFLQRSSVKLIQASQSILDIIDVIDEELEKEKDTVEIPQKEYNKLSDSDEFLLALRAAGVDNWDGYDIAQDLVKEWNKEENGDD